ncbi:MAG: hypothetical protein OHK0022_46370 [Roseiflexaceae bacterium]
MVRVLPSFTHTCHVCGTQFTVQNETQFSGGRPQIVQTPTNCPACGAPIRAARPVEIGGVKDLILTHYGLPEYRKEYGTAQRFLEAVSLRPEDVDRYLDLLQQLDFAEWQQLDARQKAGQELTSEDRKETKIIGQARTDHERGKLLPVLRQAAEQAKATIQQERERYLQTYAERQTPNGADQ